MMDVAVLLNLTEKISFEVADPLMSVINAARPLLFYDRLTVVPFPTDETKCQQHIEQLVCKLRNLLEARTLSAEDENEKIRVIVMLDLARGAFQPEGPSRLFPAQKVRLFKETIEHIFEESNPLLERFEYIFVFLAGQTPLDNFYKTLAYDGITGGGSVGWLSRDNLKLNEFRDDFFEKLPVAPPDEMPLAHATIKDSYALFRTEFDTAVQAIADRMNEAGLKDAFTTLAHQRIMHIDTVGEFSRFDYNGAVLSCVSQLLGLSSDDFRSDCSFFILQTDSSTINMRLRCESFILSLVQLLATIGTTDYDNILKAKPINASARLFFKDLPESDCIDTGAFAQLSQLVKDCYPHLENARWKKDQKVIIRSYSLRADDPMTIDAYQQINDRFESERQQMFDEFKNTRKVPFFFGNPVGEWSWYKRVLKSALKIFHFESINDRPLYDLPKRITDNEMEEEELQTTYTELENGVNILSKEPLVVKKVMDINDYLMKRSELINRFSDSIEKLKNEMVKLGYFTCLLWIGILSILGLTLNYAYHFWGFGTKDSPLMIMACLGVAALLFVISAILGRAKVKSRIEAVYSELDNHYNTLQRNLNDYLADVCLRLKQQNEADIRRKNLDEMKSALNAFSRHNRQVDLWIKYYQDIVTKLSAHNPSQTAANLYHGVCDDRDFDMDNATPSLPDAIVRNFREMNVQFSVKGAVISNVTSFVNNFKFVEEE